jgi:acetylglutamate kinase
MLHVTFCSTCLFLCHCRFVGEVTRVDPTLLRSLVNSGYIPVVATVATDESGQALNVNADTAAGEVREGREGDTQEVLLWRGPPAVLVC